MRQCEEELWWKSISPLESHSPNVGTDMTTSKGDRSDLNNSFTFPFLSPSTPSEKLTFSRYQKEDGKTLFAFIIICESFLRRRSFLFISTAVFFLFRPNQRVNSLILMTIIIRLLSFHFTLAFYLVINGKHDFPLFHWAFQCASLRMTTEISLRCIRKCTSTKFTASHRLSVESVNRTTTDR